MPIRIPQYHYNFCHSSIYKLSPHTNKDPENNTKFETHELHLQNLIRDIRL